MTLRGLTWDHPRGYAALDELAARDRAVVWDRQPLEAFESHPIADLAGRYDLLVVDHPGLGEAVTAGCLLPLGDLLDDEELAHWRKATVGASFDSYHLDGEQWALPVDAASQVSVAAAGAPPPPSTWGEVAELDVPFCLSLGGPHALLTLFSVCVALGAPPARPDPEVLLEADAGRQALDVLAGLTARAEREVSLLNPIGILELLASSEVVACCPLVFGYVTYSGPQQGRRPLSFADAPRWREEGPIGSTLGGTGIAVSARVHDRAAAAEQVRTLISEEAQTRVFPAAGSQPAARAAWTDPVVNRRWAVFFEATLQTVEQAWVRPRHAGYVAFQQEGSALVRDALEGRVEHAAALRRLQDRYAASRRGR